MKKLLDFTTLAELGNGQNDPHELDHGPEISRK
jgi:hypothetical protein